MSILKFASVAALVATVAATGCDSTTTATEPSTEIAVQSALMGVGESFSDGGPRPAIMGHLVHRALAKIGHDVSRDSARAAGDHLKALVDAAHSARQSGDSVAAKAAMEAVRAGEAEIVIAAFGSEVVTHSLTFANERMAALNDRIAKASANDHEKPRLEALAASLNQILADANAAAAAGDNVSALIGASKVIEALHIVNERRPFGPPGSTPLDTTRVRRPHP
jgi:hypothetical protein